MKKKPPPGATLIARLKEQRLAREAELAKRQAQGSEGDAVEASQSAPELAVDEPESEIIEPSTAAEAVEEESTQSLSEPEIVQTPKAAKSGGKKSATVDAEPIQAELIVASPMQTPAAASNGGSQDLLHRQIEIEDLRPNSTDYFVLTDEIRLAGRFAAVGLIAQGLRLACLRADEIYKEHYQTFEDYCRKEHQMSATYAYRLIRMAEMAERIAQIESSNAAASQSDAMPDPFEVLLSLGHRHIMALLPLEVEAAQDLLVRGIPLSEDGQSDERVPIVRATERQIKDALKGLSPAVTKTVVTVLEKKALASEKQLIPALSKLVEMLEDWSLWLGGEAPAELEAARMGRAQLLNRLGKRFRTASGRIADALEGGEDK